MLSFSLNVAAPFYLLLCCTLHWLLKIVFILSPPLFPSYEFTWCLSPWLELWASRLSPSAHDRSKCELSPYSHLLSRNSLRVIGIFKTSDCQIISRHRKKLAADFQWHTCDQSTRPFNSSVTVDTCFFKCTEEKKKKLFCQIVVKVTCDTSRP